MSRPLRLEFPGACYHVTARGDRQEAIFEDDGDRLAFLDLLAREVAQQHWLLYAYCLMGNHFHLLLETPEPNLVRGMRRLNGVYTQAFNRRHGRVGHVLQGRYKSILVDKDSYLLELCRYVVLNPVRAGMVPAVEAWPWSSYPATAGRTACPSWLAGSAVVALFGEGARGRAAYRRFVAEGTGRPESPWDEVRGQIYLGSDEFRTRMEKQAASRPARGVSRRQLQPVRPTPKAIVKSVADAFGIKPSAVLDRTSGAAFKFAVYMLRRRGNLSLQEAAELAGVSIGRVSQIQTEIESKEVDPVLDRLVAALQRVGPDRPHS